MFIWLLLLLLVALPAELPICGEDEKEDKVAPPAEDDMTAAPIGDMELIVGATPSDAAFPHIPPMPPGADEAECSIGGSKEMPEMPVEDASISEVSSSSAMFS